jgi:hypothetical protein
VPADRVVLVVHGIGNKIAANFLNDVVPLINAVAPREGRPVFWGDLGPDDVFGSMPGAGDGMEIDDEATGTSTDSRLARSSALVEHTTALLSERTGEAVPDATKEVVRDVLDGAARDGQPLTSTGIAHALADAVELTGPVGSAHLGDTGGNILGRIRRGLRDVVDSVEGSVDRMSTETLSGLLRDRGSGLARTITRTIGDVLAYQRSGDMIRARLDAAYQIARSEGAEVDILAHSLGALVTVEWLLGATVDGEHAVAPDDRRIGTLVTFGSQVSLFCEIHGLMGHAGLTSREAPVELPIKVERWINVWHALDPLAFLIAPVLRVPGIEIEDRRLDPDGLGVSLAAHSSYWHDPRFLAWIGRTLP